MLCRLAALPLIAALAACNPPPPEKVAVPPVVEQKAPELSAQQVAERSERCASASAEQFRRDWKDGNVPTPDGWTTADFTGHYNAKMDICFYLLRVRRFTGQGEAPAGTVSKILSEINDDERYGEYLGPATPGGSPQESVPAECRMGGIYCSSEREWNVLVEHYMEE